VATSSGVPQVQVDHPIRAAGISYPFQRGDSPIEERYRRRGTAVADIMTG
jgi:hypothetical protein